MAIDIRETIAGGIGAICCAYSGNPFDVIKVRLQTQNHIHNTTTSFYSGPIDCFTKICKEEGILALWKGVTPALSSAFIENSVLFSANGVIRRFYTEYSGKDADKLTFQEHALMGGASGVFSATCITPAEMIKCRTQVNHKKSSPWRALITVMKEEGIRGLFRGLSSTIGRDVPFTFIFFGGYSAWTTLLCSTKSWVLCSTNENGRVDEDVKLNPFGIYLAGGFAGACAWSVTFPIDSVKSRIQTSPTSASFVSVMNAIFREQGIRGFYKGWSSAVVRAFPANAGLFLGYETAMKLMK
mmetsp:Transcript_23933/g.35135  ORF Transcript_23933/g.35135 Transcript_23933/m.35135 type:complete len:298 (+) Transcript_23933:40-933(+)